MTKGNPTTPGINGRLTLFLTGAGLAIVQFVLIRDFTTILYGEELVIVLVTAAFFLTLSLGYRLALKPTGRVFRLLLALSLLAHLTLPHTYRHISAWGATWGMGGWGYGTILFLHALLFNAALAMFLPRTVHATGTDDRDRPDRIRIYYSAELLGFAAGLFLISLTWNHPEPWLLPIHWTILLLLGHRTVQKPAFTALFAAGAVLATVLLPHLDPLGTARLYERKQRVRGAKILYSVDTPYQRVDILENHRGERLLYLDGLLNLNSTDLDDFNHYLAVLPARLIWPRHALIIGNGTLSSVPKIAPYSGRITSVELDEGVLAGGTAFFTNPSRLKKIENWQLVVDDGKHFLSRSREKYDLIIMDVPSPFTVQVGALHTREFYRLAKKRLTVNGVISVQLSGMLQKNNHTPAQITAALRQVFGEVIVVGSFKGQRGFAYAGDRLPFTADRVRHSPVAGERRLQVFETAQVDEMLTGAVPFSLDRMDRVLLRGWERVRARYFSR